MVLPAKYTGFLQSPTMILNKKTKNVILLTTALLSIVGCKHEYTYTFAINNKCDYTIFIDVEYWDTDGMSNIEMPPASTIILCNFTTRHHSITPLTYIKSLMVHNGRDTIRNALILNRYWTNNNNVKRKETFTLNIDADSFVTQ